MMLVAIHQPNYAPWLGYFHKMAMADVFVFLDDAQFSKGSYTNRVQIGGRGGPRWLTVPVRHAFGAAINAISPAQPEWPRAHLDSLLTAYRDSARFREVWPDVQALYEALPFQSLAAGNSVLVERLAERLGIGTRTLAASSLDVGSAAGDDRLIAICRQLGNDASYLSGRGGAKYQDEAKFSAAGIPLQYTDFEQRSYPQGGTAFVAGLSVLDVVFHIGWKGTAATSKVAMAALPAASMKACVICPPT
jgi:WbqC-like protein family